MKIMKTKDRIHGEGNYEAARRYDEAAARFAASGRVEAAAHAAAPRNDEEAAQMQAAETAGRRRARDRFPPQDQRTDTGRSAHAHDPAPDPDQKAPRTSPPPTPGEPLPREPAIDVPARGRRAPGDGALPPLVDGARHRR
jgi:hypothetical protein